MNNPRRYPGNPELIQAAGRKPANNNQISHSFLFLLTFYPAVDLGGKLLGFGKLVGRQF
jgi:hypothetical protein